MNSLLHHISFAVTDLQRSLVFYDAVLGTLGYERVWSEPAAAGYGLPGGLDNGAPGLRPGYGASYFAAFVVDPDGYRIEAVFSGQKPGGWMENES